MSAKTAELAQLIEKMTPNSTVLYLRGYGLETLPEDIGTLTYLTKLNLNGNRLTSLPESIGNLTNLTELYLNGHKLTILPESICNLTNLTRLDLNSGFLCSLPDNIGNLTKLTHLNLKSNRLIELPESISNLTQLISLNIYRNPLSKLPENIGNLTKISHLRPTKGNGGAKSDRNLNRLPNNLTRLPNSIGNLVNLKQLALQGCQVTELPDSIGNLTKLNQLYLSHNQLNVLPEGIGKLKNLTKIVLHGNPLIDLSILNKLPKLEKVSFLADELARRYWTKLSEWKSEWLLDERDPAIKVTLIEQLGFDRIFADLAKITTPFQLNLNNCTIVDNLAGIGKLRNLTRLEVYNNKVKILPDEIGKLSRLSMLNIGANQISSLPDCLALLKRLSGLYAEYNNIRNLPQFLSHLTELKYLNLIGNPIEDLSMLQDLPALEDVWLFGAKLPRRYWKKFSEWKSEWLLDEENIEIRRRLIEYLSYEKICQDLGAIAIDTWREYTLLKIEDVDKIFDWQGKIIHQEPMVLLKMTCPSTGHVHILRVPPDMTSAEDAIVWVNHGIHPDRFTVQT